MDELRTHAEHTDLAALTGALAASGDSAGNPDRLLWACLHAVRTHLDMEVGFISEFHDQHRRFRLVDEAPAHRSTLQPGHSDPLEETYCQRCVDGRLPEVIHDAQTLPAAHDLPVTHQLAIGAHMSVPVKLSDGTIYGTFCCFSQQANSDLGGRDLGYIRAFADVAGQLIDDEIQALRSQAGQRQAIDSVLANDQLRSAWQPIVAAEDGKLLGMEALTRFPATVSAWPTPDAWFRAAAGVGMLERLEHAAIGGGLALLPDLPTDAYVSVNVSAAALHSDELLAMLSRAPLSRIVLEITEHDVVEDYEALAGLLRPLRDEGLRIAVDDLGAGYASLRHLLRLNPDLLKIDLALTRDVDSDSQRQALIRGLVRYARTAGSKVVAEGVETDAEWAALRELEVDALQGYRIARPQPREQALAESLMPEA